MPYRVSPQRKLNSFSPPMSKPMKNLSTFTPHILATAK